MDTVTKISSGGDNSEPQRIGSFVVLSKLGQGGMGAVYKAHDPALDRIVALKLLPPHLTTDADFVARFKREAAAAAKFNHPNIVQVYAAGEDAGTHFIAMELVEGESLQKRIQRSGKLDCDEAVAITIYAAEALRYAWNKAKLIHRDIKPDNILLSTEGDVKVADLGLAKMLGGASTDFTHTGTVMGSPHYISPEQGRGDKDLDFRSDVYSLGCTLYHMLTGKPPYEGDNVASLVHKHVYEPPPDPTAARPDCPPQVAALLKKMMAKDRAKRPATYDELIAELTATHDALSKPVSAAARNRKMMMLAGAAVAVAAAVIAGVAVWKVPFGGPRAVVAETPTRTDATERVPPRGLPKEMAVDLGDGVKMDFVLIPAGTFMMGSSECSNATPHKVTITKPFYMGKYEVTQEQWEKVMGNNPSQFKGVKNPVDNVSWFDCQQFIEKWKDKVQGHTFRLPTEAEWEYACRAGSTTDYCYGYDPDKLGDYAWFKDNSGERTHLVGHKKPNAWGLYDMQGNVREWCEDWYGNYDSNEATDPVGPSSGSFRVLRSGSWFNYASHCRSAYRISVNPSNRINVFGLRVVLEVPASAVVVETTKHPLPPPQVTATTTTSANQQKEMAVDLGDGVKMEFVLIPAGTFMMGSDQDEDKAKPVHKVTITKPFYIGKYEVTQEQWEKVMGSNPSHFKGVKYPVDSVTWDDCQDFVSKLRAKVTGQTFRLPTEAEWEHACRAGSTTDYCYGDNANKLGDYAWFKDNSGVRPHPVGQNQPNAWGLYDMHGNVWEWCLDVYHDTYEGSPADGSAWMLAGKSSRVLRGGSWNYLAPLLRSAARSGNYPDYRNTSYGFRVVVAGGTP